MRSAMGGKQGSARRHVRPWVPAEPALNAPDPALNVLPWDARAGGCALKALLCGVRAGGCAGAVAGSPPNDAMGADDPTPKAGAWNPAVGTPKAVGAPKVPGVPNPPCPPLAPPLAPKGVGALLKLEGVPKEGAAKPAGWAPSEAGAGAGAGAARNTKGADDCAPAPAPERKPCPPNVADTLNGLGVAAGAEAGVLAVAPNSGADTALPNNEVAGVGSGAVPPNMKVGAAAGELLVVGAEPANGTRLEAEAEVAGAGGEPAPKAKGVPLAAFGVGAGAGAGAVPNMKGV